MLTTDALLSTLSRDAMEAHLRLCGWVPVSYGSAGARKGRLVVYAFRHLVDHELLTQLLAPPGLQHRYDMDLWYCDDVAFGAMARACIESDRSE